MNSQVNVGEMHSPLLKTEIPGPKSRALRIREDRHLAPGLQNLALLAGIVVDSALGSTVTDVDGNTFLDIIGGIGVNGLGHSHPKFVRAIQRQVELASVGSFTSEKRLEFFERVEKYQPIPGQYRTQLYSSGAEAVESALRLAKSYTKKTEFLSFWGAFHGKTMGALSLMGSDFKVGMGPMVPGCHTVPYADPYRKPFQVDDANLGKACADFARQHLNKVSCRNLAAIIVEPIQGTAGNIIPTSDFLPALSELAKEFKALLIIDEMITGFGRTGKFWGADHVGVKADIITLGKQFGGGYPVSAVMAKEEIVNSKPWANPSGSSSSYGGNPLAAAAIAETLKIIEEEGLVENSKVMGEYFLSKLKPFEEKFPFVGDVRGVGLLLGLELVKNKKTKEPLGKEITTEIYMECVRRGLLTMAYAPSFRIQTALNIGTKTIDSVVSILDEVFSLIAERSNWR